MVENRNSGEKKKKRPIRNVPKGFKDTKENKEKPKEKLSQNVKEKVKEEAEKSEVSTKQKNEEIFNSLPNDNKESSSNNNQSHHALRAHRNKLITFSVVAAVLLLVFVFRPGILGLGVYDEAETNDTLNNLAGGATVDEEEKYSMDDLGSTIEQLKLEINSGNEKLSEFLENDINRITGDLVSCLTEKTSLEDVYEEDVRDLEDELEEKNQEIESLKAKENQPSDIEKKLSELQDEFDLLALNSAKSICCKQKVDNFDIDYYEVQGNKIVCLEEGNQSLNCFS